MCFIYFHHYLLNIHTNIGWVFTKKDTRDTVSPILYMKKWGLKKILRARSHKLTDWDSSPGDLTLKLMFYICTIQ